MSNESYTGRDRARETPKRIRRAEKTAKAFIMAGGVGTILAVTLIFGFLLWVVVPLFTGGEFKQAGDYPAAAVRQAPLLATGIGEYKLLAWGLYGDGLLRVFRLDDGSLLTEKQLLDGPGPTASSFMPEGREFMLGFADGTVRAGRIGFKVSFTDRKDAPESLRDLKAGATARAGESMVEMTMEDQLRFVSVDATLEEPVKAAPGAIRLLDFSTTPSGRAFAALGAEGGLAVYTQTIVTNMMTGEEETEIESLPIAYDPPTGHGRPAHLKLSGIGNAMYLLWEDGHAIRFDARDPSNAQAVEWFASTGGAKVTAVRCLVGKTTLVVGDADGTVRVWFPTKPSGAGTIDGTTMSMAHTLRGANAPVTSLAPSALSRLLVAGYANGDVRLFHVTTADELARDNAGAPVASVALAPRDDGVIALTEKTIRRWELDLGHPEASLQSLFGEVWYEGYPEPQHVWQSTGGTDDFEAKLGLIPLIFGTLKATLYSMLIAVPIALLAAVFTSEFLSPKLRAPIKSVVEMMASLPSVVLGFIAALVIAPFVQDVLPATLTACLTVPLALVVGARLWQLLPQDRFMRWGGTPRFLMIAASLPVGVAAAMVLGPLIENHWFAGETPGQGDLRGWLDGRVGEVGSGWTILLLPAGVLLAAWGVARFAGPWIRAISKSWSRRACALFDVGRMVGVIAIGFLLAAGGAWLLARNGIDPRQALFGGDAGDATKLGLVGTYAQRNAMIVGFVMGFAIVPIIYTLAEDALSSVPSQLREGSLATGATPWQTAVRIVVPTAMSGIFGAIMVGLGRAVGETMIVLMAAGNTPLLEWNIFNGFRTLSANIAVELPEAVRDSTHYRTLFLAALVLFAMTFLVNTAAELVRRRFRKRYAEQL